MALIEVVNSTAQQYETILASLPNSIQIILPLFLLSLVVLLFSFFIWKFYKFLAKRDIFELNLAQYNNAEHPVLEKIQGAGLYFLEYLVILPFLIFFWFSVFILFMLILSKNLGLGQIMFISAIVISAIRMASYYNEDLAFEVSKLLPLTLLAVALTEPGVLDFIKIFENISQINALLPDFAVFFGFILSLEAVLRFFEAIFLVSED